MTSVSGVGVIDKAVSLLRAAAHEPCSLADLQEATGLPRATAHRLATALEQHGLLRRDVLGRFLPGFDLIALGRAASDSFPLAELARPALLVLRDRSGESVQLYVREGDGRRCVVSLESTHGLRWIVPEGSLLPLDVGSAGRALTSASTGWVASVEEREAGVASVSAAVRDPSGEVLAAVSLSGPVERLTRDPGARFGEMVRESARDIERLVRAGPS